MRGIMMDTKNFTFKTGVRTFEAAAYLRRCGVDIIKVKKWFQSDLNTYATISEIVSKAEIIGDSIAISVYDKVDDYKGCMRFIDWNKGNPYIFRSIDFEQLMSSDRMFARKFDEKVDFDIVERIFEALDKQKR